MNGNKPTQGYRSYGSLIFAMSSNKPELNSIAYTEQTQGQDKAVHVTRKTLFCFKRIFFQNSNCQISMFTQNTNNFTIPCKR